MTALEEITAPLDGSETVADSRRAPLVLVVDDCCTSQALLRHILTAEGFQTISACTAEQAVQISETAGVDLILLDVMLPDGSGFDVCAEIRSNPVTTDIPVLFVSALDDVESRVRGLKAGGVDYINKPFHARNA
jgi:DNA-binding response OmpR family regulator